MTAMSVGVSYSRQRCTHRGRAQRLRARPPARESAIYRGARALHIEPPMPPRKLNRSGSRLRTAMRPATMAFQEPAAEQQSSPAHLPGDAILAAVARERCLSGREVDVLAATARGETTKEIAFALRISTKTVEYYWTRIFEKLPCGSKVEAMAFLFRRASSCAPSHATRRAKPSAPAPR